jgi:xylan 1,4-beta-xylosidase
LWHYHDDDVSGPEAAVSVTLSGLPVATTRVLVRRYCIDDTHSNSYAAWMRMGSPAVVAGEPYADLERAASLATCGSPEWRDVTSGTTALQFALPRQAVSLLDVSW